MDEGLKEYSVTKFFAETEIQDDVTISGSSMAQESFLSFSLELKNDFFVNKDLKTTKGSINAKSCLQVGGNLISSGDITVQKSCQVGGLITGNNLRFKGINLSAQSIKAETLRMQGNITIQNGIIVNIIWPI